MIHALPEAVVAYPWPSTQRASQMLAERCAEGLLLRAARERLAFYFEQFSVAA